MMSSALRSLKSKASFAVVGSVVAVFAVLGGVQALAQVAAEAVASEAPFGEASESLDTLKALPTYPTGQGANPFRDRFPDVVLKTHEGRNVRFYEDLIKDKIVMINFMYATCTER